MSSENLNYRVWAGEPFGAALDNAIPPIRLSAFMSPAHGDVNQARQLYVWDRDVAMSLLADIAIIEVAFRNALNRQLVEHFGVDWPCREIGLDDRSKSALSRAWKYLPPQQRDLDHLIPLLTFGFWRNLLESGGFVGRAPQRFAVSYELLWRASLHRAFPGGKQLARLESAQYTRTWVLQTVSIVHAARNRAAHHEPFIAGFPLPGQKTRANSLQAYEQCLKLARLIDRNLGNALAATSKFPEILMAQPK